MGFAHATGLLALSILAVGETSPEAPPLLFHWTQPATTARGEPSFEVMKRMIVYLGANYPDEPGPRVFVSRLVEEPTFHWFQPLEGLDERIAADQARMTDEGWQALEDQVLAPRGARTGREVLLHLGGAEHGGARMPHRWMRVSRARPTVLDLARRHAGEVADYLEANYPDIDARAYSTVPGTAGSIYLFIDARTLDSWAAARRAMLRDDTYVALMERAEGLFLEDAEELLLLDVEMDPARVGPLELGRLLEDWGDREGAILSFREALERDPRDVAALTGLGDALYDQGRGDAGRALAPFERALELDPGNTDALHSVGLCLMAMGEHERAAAVFREVLEREPDHKPALFNLAMTLKNLRQWEAAIEVFGRHLEAGPSPSFAAYSHKNRGDCLRALGNLDGAIASYRSALEIRPEWPELNEDLGRALYENRQQAEAVRALERAVHLYAEPSPLCGFYLALAHAGLGDADEARAWYERAVEWAGEGEASEELDRLRARAGQAVGAGG